MVSIGLFDLYLTLMVLYFHVISFEISSSHPTVSNFGFWFYKWHSIRSQILVYLRFQIYNSFSISNYTGILYSSSSNVHLTNLFKCDENSTHSHFVLDYIWNLWANGKNWMELNMFLCLKSFVLLKILWSNVRITTIKYGFVCLVLFCFGFIYLNVTYMCLCVCYLSFYIGGVHRI